MKRWLIVVVATVVLTAAACDLSQYVPPPPHSLGWARDKAEDVRDAELSEGELQVIYGCRLDDEGRIVSHEDSCFTFHFGDGYAGLLVRVDYDGTTFSQAAPAAPEWETVPRYDDAESWINAGDAAALDEGLNEEDIDVRLLTVTADFNDQSEGVDNYALLWYYAEDEYGGLEKTAEIWLDADTDDVLQVDVYPPAG
jgi:hypothetical protein